MKRQCLRCPVSGRDSEDTLTFLANGPTVNFPLQQTQGERHD